MRIPRGTPIAVCAPSGVHDPARLQAGLDIARERGHDLRPLPDLLRPHRYLAGDDEHRLNQLVQALTDPAYGAVWIARGGYGLTRLLDRLPWSTLDRRPVIGFSDVTALFAALHARGLGPCVHGPVVHSLAVTEADSLDALFALLDGEPAGPWAGSAWIPGQAEGPLVGGNLCLLAATCGTSAQLDAAGKILLLEEVGEPAYKIDRMLQQLVAAGVLDGVAGVAVGELASCRPPEGARWTLHEVFVELLAPLGVPVLGELPVGHGARNHPFVWGTPARIDGQHLVLGA